MKSPSDKKKKGSPSGKPRLPDNLWLYGKHACYAALENPDRVYLNLILSENARSEYADIAGRFPNAPKPETGDKIRFDKICGADVPHQGIALQVRPLRPDMPVFLDGRTYTAVILDHVTDPRNVGAVLRSAAAFGVDTVYMHERHAPPESGALAKASSGCIERVPLIRVKNIAQLIESLQKEAFSVAGLDIRAEHSLTEATFTQRQAFLLGSEGKGARRLPQEKCDRTFRLPMEENVESLNISVTAGITLYTRYAAL